jgi:hypothetical protein
LANLKLIITWRFFLEAKAFWEHTCIAGGLFLLPIQRKKGNGQPTIPFAMSPPGFEAVRVLKHWFFFGLLYGTSPVGADSLCNDFYVMIIDEISA